MVFRIPLYLVIGFFVFAPSYFLCAQSFDQEYYTGPQPEPDYTPPPPTPQISQPTTQPSASGSSDPTSSAIGPAWSSPPSQGQSRSLSTSSNSPAQPQKSKKDCEDDCVDLKDGGFCFRECMGQNPCPDGQHIETPADEVRICVADDPAAKGTDDSPVAKCEQALKDVSDTCRLENDSDIQQIMQVSKQFSSGMANNAVTACTDIGKLASSANLAMHAFESKCQAEYTDCTKACNPNSTENKGLLPADKAALRNNQAQCKKYSQQVKPSDLDAQRAMQSQVTGSCDNLLAKLGMDCLRNPSGPGCSSLKINPNDCKNGANGGNPVCLCINNPSACSNLSKGLANLPSGNGGIEGDGGGLGSAGGGLPGGALSLGDDMIGLEGKSGFSGVNTGAGGGRGGGGYGSGDSGSGGRGKPGYAMKTGPDANIYKGNYGGGAAFGGPGGAGGGAGYRDQNGNAVPKGSVVDKNGRIRPDFSKFYPNMKYDPGRGLAGISGPDGITGPATNLFNKVNNQFRSQAKTFLP